MVFVGVGGWFVWVGWLWLGGGGGLWGGVWGDLGGWFYC